MIRALPKKSLPCGHGKEKRTNEKYESGSMVRVVRLVKCEEEYCKVATTQLLGERLINSIPTEDDPDS